MQLDEEEPPIQVQVIQQGTQPAPTQPTDQPTNESATLTTGRFSSQQWEQWGLDVDADRADLRGRCEYVETDVEDVKAKVMMTSGRKNLV